MRKGTFSGLATSVMIISLRLLNDGSDRREGYWAIKRWICFS